jgi:hypothetical protein
MQMILFNQPFLLRTFRAVLTAATITLRQIRVALEVTPMEADAKGDCIGSGVAFSRALRVGWKTLSGMNRQHVAHANRTHI